MEGEGLLNKVKVLHSTHSSLFKIYDSDKLIFMVSFYFEGNVWIKTVQAVT